LKPQIALIEIIDKDQEKTKDHHEGTKAPEEHQDTKETQRKDLSFFSPPAGIWIVETLHLFFS
jgi:hypothetical protein